MIAALSHYEPFQVTKALLLDIENTLERPARRLEETVQKVARLVLFILFIPFTGIADLILIPLSLVARLYYKAPPLLPPPQIQIQRVQAKNIFDRPRYFIKPASDQFLKDAIEFALTDKLDREDYRELLKNHGLLDDPARDAQVDIFTWCAGCALGHALIHKAQNPHFTPPAFLIPNWIEGFFLPFLQLKPKEREEVITALQNADPLVKGAPQVKAMLASIQQKAYEIVISKLFKDAYQILYPVLPN